MHFLCDGEPLRVVLDVIELAKVHTGRNMAKAIADTLNAFGISKKLLTLTADNASPNDVMVDKLEDLIPSFGGAANRVRCFNHVTNLVARSALAPFDGGKMITLEGKGDDDDKEVADDDGEMDNVEGWTDEKTGMSEEERHALDKRVEPVATVLVKVSKKRYKNE